MKSTTKTAEPTTPWIPRFDKSPPVGIYVLVRLANLSAWYPCDATDNDGLGYRIAKLVTDRTVVRAISPRNGGSPRKTVWITNTGQIMEERDVSSWMSIPRPCE